MKYAILGTALVFACAGSFVALGQDPGDSPAGDARNAAALLFAAQPADSGWESRESAFRELNSEFGELRESALRVLRSTRPDAKTKVAFRSPLYYALQVVRVWRVQEARDTLLRLVHMPLDPATMAPGGEFSVSNLYPAAEALAATAGRPDRMIRSMTRENSRFVVWAMSDAFGKDATIALLRHFRSAERVSVDLIDDALERLDSVNSNEDLLPPWATK